jgi:hypothetical protein
MEMIELESMAIAMPEVEGHPNREPFRGVLTVVDVASQGAPSGSKGHQVLLTRAAAEAALPSLLGMALDYAPSFDRHDMQRKVGVITEADVVGRNLEIGGYIFAKDFPEVVKKIATSGRRERAAKSRHSSRPNFQARNIQAKNIFDFTDAGRKARPSSEGPGWKGSLSSLANRLLSLTIALRGGQPEREEESEEVRRGMRNMSLHAEDAGLGMSYEVTEVQVADPKARVWTLTKVLFTGAAILRRDKAAYRDTWIELGS